MHARVVLGVGKGVLFREVSSVQESRSVLIERERYRLEGAFWIIGKAYSM